MPELAEGGLPPHFLFLFNHRRHRGVGDDIHSEALHLTENCLCLRDSQPTEKFPALIVRLKCQPVNRPVPCRSDLSKSKVFYVANGELPVAPFDPEIDGCDPERIARAAEYLPAAAH